MRSRAIQVDVDRRRKILQDGGTEEVEIAGDCDH